jgi:hypothetical protein
MGMGGGGRGKKNTREWIMSKHIACVYEDGIMKHTESFLIKGREERLRESKGVNLIKVQ